MKGDVVSFRDETEKDVMVLKKLDTAWELNAFADDDEDEFPDEDEDEFEEFDEEEDDDEDFDEDDDSEEDDFQSD